MNTHDEKKTKQRKNPRVVKFIEKLYSEQFYRLSWLLIMYDIKYEQFKMDVLQASASSDHTSECVSVSTSQLHHCFCQEKRNGWKKTTHFDTSAVLDSVLSILSVLLLMFFIDTKIWALIWIRFVNILYVLMHRNRICCSGYVMLDERLLHRNFGLGHILLFHVASFR